MVGNLKFFRRDPQRGQDRGQGYYYKRTYNGKPWWSKYNESLDAIKKRPRTKTKDVLIAEKKQPHKHDYKTKGNRRTSRLGRPNSQKGYF